MAPRVALFSLLLLGLWALLTPTFMTLRPIERTTRWGRRLSRAALAAALIVVGALPLCVAISFAVELQALYRPGEQWLYIALGIACALAGPLIAWKNLTGPPVSREEAKRLAKERMRGRLGLHLSLLLAIAGCGALAWLWGRHAGLGALEKAAAEAEALIAGRQTGASSEAAREYAVLFDELKADKELRAVQEGRWKDVPVWPKGEELSRLVAARASLLRRIESLATGPRPAMEVSYHRDYIEDCNAREGFRYAGLLWELALREASGQGDDQRIMALLLARLRIGEHLAALPGRSSVTSGHLPTAETLGTVLPTITAARRRELAAYAGELAALRARVPERMAQSVREGTAANILWLRKLATQAELSKDDEPFTDGGRNLYTLFLIPLYGQESVTDALPTARRLAEVIELPFERARATAGEMSVKLEPRIGPDCLLTGSCPPSWSVLYRGNIEQRLGAYEAACALRLYALDNGRYPPSLAELVRRYLDAAILDPAGPVHLDYRPEPPGCRLTWNAWECSYGSISVTRCDEKGSAGFIKEQDYCRLEPTGHMSEIAIGVPPTPPQKLKRRR